MPSDPCVLESAGMDQAWGKEDRVVMSAGTPATPPAIPWCWLTFCQWTCSRVSWEEGMSVEFPPSHWPVEIIF